MPKQKTNHLDRINTEILKRLSTDGRVPYSTLAEELKCSTNAVRDRIHALERRGIITAYQAVLDNEHLGYPVHVLAFLEPAQAGTALQDAAEARQALGVRVQNVYQSTGPYALVLDMVGHSLEDIHKTLQECIYPLGYRRARLELLGQNILDGQRKKVEATA